MRFNTAQLLLGPTGGSRQYEIDDDISGLDPELRPLSRLKGMVKFTKTDHKILVTGRLRVVLELECRRCLERFAKPIEVSVEEEFQPRVDIRTSLPLPEEESDPALIVDERNILDLSEVVRQSLLLTADEHVSCSELCKGLCPECGENLNVAQCSCAGQKTDLRWAALEHVRDKARQDQS